MASPTALQILPLNSEHAFEDLLTGSTEYTGSQMLSWFKLVSLGKGSRELRVAAGNYELVVLRRPRIHA